MGALRHDLLPSPGGINAQFDDATNRDKSLHLLYGLLGAGNGNYDFGALTAAYNNWSKGSTRYKDWMADIQLYYPPEVQDFIKGCIITAMKHRKNGGDDPLKITLAWSDGTPSVTCTYDPAGRAYDIQIVGYKAPPSSALAERRRKKQ